MNHQPLVSFLIPSYNYGRFLSDCLRSIFAQQGGFDFEVIVVDDASTDDTRVILERWTDPRLSVIVHERNRGHAATVNEALEIARGQFIARIDPDDRYRPDFLVQTVVKFYDFPEVGLVYGDAAIINEQGDVTQAGCDRKHAGQDFKGNEFLALMEENFICSPTVIARRDAWLNAAPVPLDLSFHDWYFTLMMARRCEFYYVNRVIADYRVHSGNWHSRISRDGSEEKSIFRLLDQIYVVREDNPVLERKKQRLKGRIYAAHYRTLADKYFGFGMDDDARRCYIRAVRLRLSHVFTTALVRRLLGTYLGRRRYEALKLVLKRGFRRNMSSGDV